MTVDESPDEVLAGAALTRRLCPVSWFLLIPIYFLPWRSRSPLFLVRFNLVSTGR